MIKKVLMSLAMLVSSNVFSQDSFYYQKFMTVNQSCEDFEVTYMIRPEATLRFKVLKDRYHEHMTRHNGGIWIHRIEVKFLSRPDMPFACNVEKVLKKGTVNVRMPTCAPINLCNYVRVEEELI